VASTSSQPSQVARRTKNLESRLAEVLITSHPSRAAVALERLGLTPTIDFFATLPVAKMVKVVPLLSPQFAAQSVSSLSDERLAEVLNELPLDIGARLVRLLGDRMESVTDRLDEDVRDALRELSRFPEDSAGGLMDPRVLSLPSDLTAAEALDRVRELSLHARYNLYVVDRNQMLVGVLNLRELLIARPTTRLSKIMVTNPHRLHASASRTNIVSHPGWRDAHSLPVVDDAGHYLGTVRYGTLRSLEASLRKPDENQTSEALGELLSVGVGGVVRALSGSESLEDR
jgi:magnesium transporter